MWRDLLDEISSWYCRWQARGPYPLIPNLVRRRIIRRIMLGYWMTVGMPDATTWKSVADLKVEEALWRWAGCTEMADRVARSIRASDEFNWKQDLPRLSFRDLHLLRTGEWLTPGPTNGEALAPPDGPVT